MKLTSEIDDCINHALNHGYRFFDCAAFYGNQVEIGQVLKKSSISRSELYLESKVGFNTL